jgi:3-(3-hydroxy-phenyl)propionate hydroxylase
MDVVIAGGGPTGMVLAADLTLAGVDAVIVERRADQSLDGSRAGGLHPRTLEVLDQRGVVERFTSEGQTHPAAGFAQIRLDITDLPTRHNHLLALWQRDIERILAGWVEELGVATLRRREVVGFTQDERGVDVELADGDVLRGSYLVGCDGGRSVVRKAAGIDFGGWDPTTSWMIAEVDMDEPELGMRREGGGIGPVDPGQVGGPYRAVLVEPRHDHTTEPTLEDLRALLVATYGTDFGARTPSWISRFTDTTRQAATYRQGRVLLAGDAAHVHPPHGGQGLNIGVQDAVNLGWKLAQVVKGISPDDLLDTYHAERHPVGARVLRNTMAQVALITTDDRHEALRETVTDLLGLDEPRRQVAAMITGLDVCYVHDDPGDLGDPEGRGEAHPLVGRRVPDLDLRTADGPTRMYAQLHAARPVLVDLGGGGRLDLGPWADRVCLVEATVEATSALTSEGRWELPRLGLVDPPAAVLIRPDGHVAWAGHLGDPALPRALTTWFGPPSGGSDCLE